MYMYVCFGSGSTACIPFVDYHSPPTTDKDRLQVYTSIYIHLRHHGVHTNQQLEHM